MPLSDFAANDVARWDFIFCAAATFWDMSLVRIYPGGAYALGANTEKRPKRVSIKLREMDWWPTKSETQKNKLISKRIFDKFSNAHAVQSQFCTGLYSDQKQNSTQLWHVVQIIITTDHRERPVNDNTLYEGYLSKLRVRNSAINLKTYHYTMICKLRRKSAYINL